MPDANTLPCIKRDNLRFRNRRGGGNFVLFLFTFLVVGGTINTALCSCIVNACYLPKIQERIKLSHFLRAVL